MKLLADLLMAAITVILLSPLWWLPWRSASLVGRWYGYAVCAAWPLARRAGMINFRRAFGPTASYREARDAVWSVFGNLGQSVADGLQFGRRFKDGQHTWERLIAYEDPDLERQVLADPRPKVVVATHLGSWEVAIGLAAVRIGRKGAVVVRRIDNPFLNAVLKWVRLRSPSEWIEKRGAAHGALQRLRSGESVAMLLDENAGRRGVFVDFFGRPASTSRLPALLALMTGAPIVLITCVRRNQEPRFVYRLATIEPAQAADDSDRPVLDLTQRIVATCERWIREDPLQWRWVHWRWKTRPDGTEERYGRRELDELFSTRLPAAPVADRKLS